MTISCAAILCVRNECFHIRRVLQNFIDQGIEVTVIDHESDDGTKEICEEFLGRGLIQLEHMPWNGEYDLTAQLEAKARVIERLPHDWVIHADADEWLQSPKEGETLLDGIDRMSNLGFNVVNFEEFVFLPVAIPAVDPHRYHKQILHYYYFVPQHNRLMRAWKKVSNLQNIHSGGHRLTGENIRLAAETFILRHYPVLSYEHAIRKYVGRVFSTRDISKNWHGNRLGIKVEDLRMPAADGLKKLEHWNSVQFDRTDPKKKHYWQWV